ncbi:MAG TPA: methionine adenosyltransferase, partial [Tepidisphaeraceae bacterium]|nr:methionine adenosyltransferase [Tepidisphaeraceae bacterium]
GHPDKVADQISDGVLDAIFAEELKQNNDLRGTRVACETLCTTGQVIVAGEVKTNIYVDIQEIVRETIKSIGYIHQDIGFSYDSCGVLNAIHSQSADIARGVDAARDAGATTSAQEEGAGDQGMMFGFACRETDDLMPLPIWLSHRIVEKQAELRDSGALKYLRPDAKSQVTVEYEGDVPKRVHTVVMSTQHDTTILKNEVITDDAKKEMIEKVIKPCIPEKYFHDKIIYHINPTGRFVIGGPHGDTGLTGRKIIVDTYGGRGRHGGGAFSGKDPTKVDRSAAYMARYVAKNIVAAGLADEVEVQLAYAIGIAKPVSVFVDTYGTAKISEEKIAEIVSKTFPLTPRGIINHLKLLAPIYRPTAAHGHFGRKAGSVKFNGKSYETFTWEKTDMADALKKAAGV